MKLSFNTVSVIFVMVNLIAIFLWIIAELGLHPLSQWSNRFICINSRAFVAKWQKLILLCCCFFENLRSRYNS